MKLPLLLPLLLLTSCAIFTPEQRTDLNRQLPERFTLYSETEMDSSNRWWTSFQSPELNGLIEQALTNSPDIRQAWARLMQAEAQAEKAGAARLPDLNYRASASANQNKQTSEAGVVTRDSFNSFNIGLAAGYELDLWNRIGSLTEAAALDRDASHEEFQAAAITLTANIASRWMARIAEQRQIDVIQKQLIANRTTLELIELRFRNALSSALDVYQQRQTVANTESQIPRAELREILLRSELAALLGRFELTTNDLTSATLPTLAPLPSVGIPADLLANRPDVRRAGLRLRSAEWLISSARADRLPAIRLTAEASYGERDIRTRDIFDNWAANLAAGITGPVFDGGRRRAEVRRARAVAEERLAVYRETVINAVIEVENAMASEQKQHAYIEALDRRLEAARRAHEESINRYRNGLVEYTTVLIQLNALQNLEREYVGAQRDLLQSRIDLYRALGGRWPEDLNLSEENANE